MQKKLTWSLTATALALFAFIYFFERKIPSTAERNTAPRLLPGVAPQDITAIEVAFTNGAVVRAEQTNGTWFLAKPGYPAQQSDLENFVTNIVRLRRLDKIPNHEVAIQGQNSFGLDPARMKLLVEAGTNQFQFEVGGMAPLTSNIYVRVLPTNQVVVTEGGLLESLPSDTNDWRSEHLLQWSGLKFDHLQLRTGQRGFELGQNPTNKLWQITRPIPARGDQLQISSLFDQLSRAQVSHFIADGPVDLDRYGLTTPEVELGFSEGTNRFLTVQFGGNATNETNHVYARLLGNSNLVTVSRDLVQFLKQPYKAFHDPRLMTMDNIAALDRIRVKFLEEFALQRAADGRWTVTAKETFPADLELLGDFVNKLFRLRILDIAKEVPTEADLQALGLLKPAVTFALFQRVTNAPNAITNTLYSELAFGTNTTDRIYASRSDETPVYITEFAKFLELPRAGYELRERQIWSFPTSSVVRVSIIAGGATNSAARSGAGWASDPLADAAIGEAVFRLSNLKALRWVAQGEERKKSLAIGTEVLEVEVKTENGTEVRRVPLGKLTMQRNVYAEHPQVNALIFEFPGEIYHLLKQNLPAAK
jgi:hypothetical protein